MAGSRIISSISYVEGQIVRFIRLVWRFTHGPKDLSCLLGL